MTGRSALLLEEPPEPISLEQGIREGRAAIVSSKYPDCGIKITSRYDERTHIILPSLSWERTPLGKAILQHMPQPAMQIAENKEGGISI